MIDAHAKSFVRLTAMFAAFVAAPIVGEVRPAHGQQISALRQLDRNGNGRLDSNEVDSRTRGVIVGLAETAGVNTRFPMSLQELEAGLAKRNDRSRGNGSATGQNVRGFGPGTNGVDLSTVQGFGNGTGTTFVPGFSMDLDAVNRADLRLAKESLAKFDRNEDELLSERELRALRLRGNPTEFDANRDRHWDLHELAAALAMQRALGREVNLETDEERDRRRRDERRQADVDRRQERRDRDAERQLAQRNERIVTGVMQQFDFDEDGVLTELECRLAGHDMSLTDTNGDLQVSEDELLAWIERNTPEAAPPKPHAPEPPDWFQDKDVDGDGEVRFVEFVNERTRAQAEEFARLDANSDGIITAEEAILQAYFIGDYQQNKAVVIPAGAPVTSKIVIDDDFILEDLNVHLSITHSRDEDLDIYLINPDSVRVRLVAGVGGSDDNFDGTIIDDEAFNAFDDRDVGPPFAGRYRSSGMSLGDMTCLRDLYVGEASSARGTWQLVIDAERSDRVGILHRWALTVTPPDGDGADDQRTNNQRAGDRGIGR